MSPACKTRRRRDATTVATSDSILRQTPHSTDLMSDDAPSPEDLEVAPDADQSEEEEVERSALAVEPSAPPTDDGLAAPTPVKTSPSPSTAPSPVKEKVKLFFDESSEDDAGPSSERAMDVDRASSSGEDELDDENDKDWRAEDAEMDADILEQISKIDAVYKKAPARPAASSSRQPKASTSKATTKVHTLQEDSDSDIEYVSGHSGLTPVKESKKKGAVKGGIKGRSSTFGIKGFGSKVKREEPKVEGAPTESEPKRRRRLQKEMREGALFLLVCPQRCVVQY